MIRRLLMLAVLALPAAAQEDLGAMGAPPNPKVAVRWNRFYDTKEIGEILDQMGAAFPRLAKLHTIG